LEKLRYDVFLSHATLDKPVVEELARLLKKAGFEPWLDKWNLIPGEPWQEAIEKALEECATCAVCLGPSGTGPWQNEEMRAAIDRRVSDRSRHFRVIPVLLPHSERGEPSRLPAFLRATTWVEFRDTLGDENALHRLIRGIQGVPPGPDPGEAVAEGAQPYRGLQVFDVADALFFFGREALTEWLLDKLRTDTGNRFLAIVGPSGSGKSSLARAGLLAALKQGEIPGSDAWAAAICKPGEQPLESLAVALAGAARLGDSPSAVLNLIRDLGANPSMLHLTTRLSLRDAPADRRLVVLVDQFEEVFTLCPDEAQRQALIANLLHAATAADGRTVVILTLRADFYGRCAAYPDLATAVADRQSLVGPMTRDELRSAIERPAYLAGCELEGGLTDLLLNEVESQPGSLPLLEHALLQIWQRREGGRRLTIDAYHDVGGVAGALEKHAEEIYSGFTAEEGEICRRVFLRLVQVDEQGRATKRRLGLEELPGEGVVSRLTNARLLTTDQEKHPTVELAHEALLANWERLKQWIEQNREALRTRRRLDEAVAEWLGRGRDSSFLLEGGRLAQAEEWATGHPAEMGQEARDLLAASIAERDHESQRELDQAKALEEEQRRRADSEHQRAEEQTRARRRLKTWIFTSYGTAALALVVAILIGILWRAAVWRHRVDLAEQLAARSNQVLESDPMLGLLLAIKAVKLSVSGGQPHLPSSEAALRTALAKSRGVPLLTGRIRAASLSAESRYLALAGTDGVMSIWDLVPAAGPVKIAAFPVARSVRQIALGSGHHWLVFAGENGSSQLCRPEASGCTSTLNLDGEDWLAGSDPFSPDSRWLMTRREGSQWQIRDLTQLSQSPNILPMTGLTALAFSSDSRWLATAEPGSLRIWNLQPVGTSPRVIQIPQEVGIASLAFSSDVQWLVAGEKLGAEGTVQAWSLGRLANDPPMDLDACTWKKPNGPNLADPALVSHIGILAGCSIHGVAVAEKTAMAQLGERTAIGFVDGRLWVQSNVSTPESGFQKGPVNLLALQRQRLVAQSGSEAPRVFDDVLDGLEPTTLYHSRALVLEALSSDGLKLWKNENDRTLWLQGSHRSWPLPYSDEIFESVGGDFGGIRDQWRFSQDSRWLATLSQVAHKPVLWQLDDQGKPAFGPFLLTGPKGHSAPVTTLTFSPDSHWVASGDAAGESRLWNLRALRNEPMALVNHREAVSALAFNGTGRLLATAGEDGVVRIFEIVEGQVPRMSTRSPANRGEPVLALAFLSGDRLAISSSSRITLWGADQGDLESPGDEVSQLLSSPEGTHLAGVANGKIIIWYPKSNGELLSTPVLFPSMGDEPSDEPSISFTSKDDRLETYDGDSTLARWDLDIDRLLGTACRAAGRNLTEREWKQYIHSETYQECEPCPELPKAYD
jgi:WD40 repeat protein